MASSDVVNKPPSRTTPAAGRAGWAMAVLGGVRRTTVLLLLAAVVLSLNLVAGNGAAEDRPDSFSEIAQTDARASAAELARMAGTLSTAPAVSSRALAAELASQAEILTQQSVLLARPGSLRRGTATEAAPASGSPGGTAEYVGALAVSARTSLDAAVRADGATARLLASAGAAQQVLAVRAADAAGLAAPAAWTPADASGAASRCLDEPAPVPGTAGRKGSTPTPTPSSDAADAGSPAGDSAEEAQDRPAAAAALSGAIHAEYGAAYAYEVAMARTPYAAARTALAESREKHLDAGARGVQLLPDLCLPALTPAPAYTLPASFGEDAAEDLLDLESALPAAYADLAACSTGTVRIWAVERLVRLSTDLYAEEADVPASPGLDAEPAGLPWAAGTE